MRDRKVAVLVVEGSYGGWRGTETVPWWSHPLWGSAGVMDRE